MDEFDLEATPLAADDARTAAESPPAGAGHARGADAAARRSAPRGRAWRALGTVAAVLLALALLWRVVPGAQPGIAGLLHVPAPTPALPIPPGGDVFYWEHAVPWGTLRVDGHAGPDLAIAPTVDRATGYLMPPFFRLPRGEHTLRYSAAQFPPLSCVVFVPDIERDSCREPVAIAGVSPPALVGPPARVLDLGASVDRLPPDALRALVAATQVAVETLDERATVAPGMAYLGADGRSVVAAQPLSASLDARVNVDPRYTQVGFNGPCVSFCDLVGLNTLAADAWVLTAHVVVGWEYAQPDGQILLDQAPAAPDADDEHIGVVIEARWSGQWRVLALQAGYGQPYAPACAVSEAIFDRDSGDPRASPTLSNYHWPYVASLPDLGCLFAGGQSVDTSEHLKGAVALVIYRFGLLEAANPLAARLLPQLPLATPADQALARQYAPPGTKG